MRLDISAAARSRLQSGAAAITPSLMWSPTRSVSGSSPAPRESRMSRSVTMQGTGVSSSADQRRADSLGRHLLGGLAQGVRRADGQNHVGHPFSNQHSAPLSRIDLQFVRIAQAYPTKPSGQPALKGAPAYRLRRASRREMTKLPAPIRPLLALAAMAARRAGRLGLRDDHRRRRQRAGPLHRKVRHLPHARRGRDHRRRSAPTSTTPSPPRAQRARTAKRSKAWSKRRSSSRGRATATPRSRCPRTSSRARTSRTSPPTSASGRACPARRRPKVPGGPGAQVFANNGCGGCHTLAAAKSGGTGRPQPRRSPQRPERGDDRRIDRRPERQDRHRLPGERDAAQLRRNAQPRRTRRPGPVPDRRNGRRRRGPQGQAGGRARRRSPPDRSPRAAEPPPPRPLPAVGIILLAMRERLSLKVTPAALREGDRRRPRRRWR